MERFIFLTRFSLLAIVFNIYALFRVLSKWLFVSTYIVLSRRSNYSLYTRYIERKFRLISGKKYNIAVSSGSTALIGALYANKIHKYNVAACCHMIPSSYMTIFINNNQIIPIDFDQTYFCPSLTDLKVKYNRYQFKAFIYCDYYGSYENLDEIYEFCESNSVVLIRDSSHSHHYKKSTDPSSQVEHICYSFQTAKPVSGFEGGMFCTDDPQVASNFCHYGSQSKYKQEIIQRCIPVSIQSTTTGYGHKYRINPLASASLLSDLYLLPMQNCLIRGLYRLLASHPNEILSRSLFEAYNTSRSAAFCSNIVLIECGDGKLKKILERSKLPTYQRNYDLSFIDNNLAGDFHDSLSQAKLHFDNIYFVDMYSLLKLGVLPKSLFSLIILI